MTIAPKPINEPLCLIAHCVCLVLPEKLVMWQAMSNKWPLRIHKFVCKRWRPKKVFRRSRRPYSVMFSTHGFFLPLTASPTEDSENVVKQFGTAADPLLRCGLLLAGCNLKDRTDSMSDGILLGREIVETDLRGTKLVVLSACETGLGDIADGEGIAGMRQAFQLAGAESVVSTLWSIDDAETARLMKEFFAELSSGKSKSAALRQAQLTRIAALRNRHSGASILLGPAH